MANLAIFASGNGSNFEKIVRHLKDSKHKVYLICNNIEARVLKRAEDLHIEYFVMSPGCNLEHEILSVLDVLDVDLIVLAGFTKILSPQFIDGFGRDIVNIHPSLLPKYRGKHGIEKSYKSLDTKLGITIHYVDYGIDTGEIIKQAFFDRDFSETIDEIEEKIHELEHEHYPPVIERLLNYCEKQKEMLL